MKTRRYLLLLSVLALSTVSYAQQDWAKFSHYEKENKAVPLKTQTIFMGNSITEFWVKKDPNFFRKNDFIGRGISGQTSCEMLVRFRSDVINLHPQRVVILAGTNDVAENNGQISLEHILENIISMVELAKVNQIEPILCSVLPAKVFSWRKKIYPAPIIIRLNSMIERYAQKKNILYVDYHKAMKDAQGGLPEKYSPDGVHPNLKGYQLMEKIVLKALKK